MVLGTITDPVFSDGLALRYPIRRPLFHLANVVCVMCPRNFGDEKWRRCVPHVRDRGADQNREARPVKVNRWQAPKMKIRAPAAHNENRRAVGLYGGRLLEIRNGNPIPRIPAALNQRTFYVPLPVTFTSCGLPPPSSTTLSTAFCPVPTAVGAYWTVSVQVVPGATELQVLAVTL
jgi:hypothetical protein